MKSPDSPERITSEDRLSGAIWGQFVGDAAALGTHWIYDLDDRQKLYPEGVNGFEAPKEGHYHFGKVPGDQTHYGDGALVLLESIAREGKFDARAFGRNFVERFQPGIYGGYFDKATKGTLENFAKFAEAKHGDEFDFQHGADDDQLAAASRLAALVVRYLNDPDLLSVVEQATRVCQNNEHAIAYMKFNALLLSELLNASDVQTALARATERVDTFEPKLGPDIRAQVRQAIDLLSKEVTDATLLFGQSCPLPRSFPSSIHTLLKYPDNFETAVLATLRAGGDNAGRAAMVGAWLGAHLGIDAIPESWRTRLTFRDRISSAVEKILASHRLAAR
ncbi:MAG TPA: ADP-ribosylglycohydrolase family protein [Chthoniobacterales bacterium]|nr:ADP-ribosylglycohydrolase family protein [Chthoniobacterales bacterium]